MTTSAHPVKPTLNFLSLSHHSIFYQLKLEEALLRADTGNWCILNHGSKPAIVMGISGVREKLIDVDLISQKPVPVIRRFSGGGTVFIDPNTVFATWIWNSKDLEIACCPQKVFTWSTDFYQQAFSKIEMTLREYDYVIGDRKWGGNAQYFCKGRWLHHSSMLWDYNCENMQYLLMPEKRPSYRQKRSHDDFLCSLKEHYPSKKLVREKIENTMHQRFKVKNVSLNHVQEILERPHRKATLLIP
jgi:lipoate-protein ligase A